TARLRPLAAAIASADPTCKDLVIVVSGDVAYHGLAEEYEVAKAFFEGLSFSIAEHSPGARVRYEMVPGNHDCYLPESDVNLRSALVVALGGTLQTDAPDN